jgi:hypothetical protein
MLLVIITIKYHGNAKQIKLQARRKNYDLTVLGICLVLLGRTKIATPATKIVMMKNGGNKSGSTLSACITG